MNLDEIASYYDRSNVKDKSIWLYPNMWHTSFLEEEASDIIPRLGRWFNERLTTLNKS